MEQGKESKKEYARVWLVEQQPLTVGKPVAIIIELVAPEEQTAQAKSSETWKVELLVALSAMEVEVDPAWHYATLEKTKDSEPMSFAVVPCQSGKITMSVRVYLAKQMIQLFELSFSLQVADADLTQEPAGR